MKDRKDDFWKELMDGSESSSSGEKSEKDDSMSDMEKLIEYLNGSGDITSSSQQLKKEDDDFWAQFEDFKAEPNKEKPADTWQQIPQERPEPNKGNVSSRGAENAGAVNPSRLSKSQPSDKPKASPSPVQKSQQQKSEPQQKSQTSSSQAQYSRTDSARPQSGKSAETNQTPSRVNREDVRKKAENSSTSGTSKPTEEELMGRKDFEVDFDFDKEYQDVDEKIVKRGKGKRTGCISGLLYFLFVICISIVLACLGWMAAVDVLGLGEDSLQVSVTVPEELISKETRESEDENGNPVTEEIDVADIDGVADILYEKDLIKYKWIFKLFCSFSNADEKIKAGTYVLNMNYDYRALVYGMNPASGQREEIEITIPEGYSTYQIVTLLSDEGVCSADDLWEAIESYEFEYDFIDPNKLGERTRLEGFLFPDTYKFYIGDNASRVINKLLSNFDNKWTDEYQALADDLGYTQYEILTVASMIEKEAGNDEERPTIASVIYNRLKDSSATNGLLQIDATIYYAIQGTDQQFSTSIDSPYNTYLYKGLTPTPIANPGASSIEAALNPDSTDYYYYALGTDGVHHFFTNLDDQTAFINSDQYAG